jgi:hypothetical protein
MSDFSAQRTKMFGSQSLRPELRWTLEKGEKK